MSTIGQLLTINSRAATSQASGVPAYEDVGADGRENDEDALGDLVERAHPGGLPPQLIAVRSSRTSRSRKADSFPDADQEVDSDGSVGRYLASTIVAPLLRVVVGSRYRAGTP